MSIGLFTDEVIDHFSNPRNTGEMEDANGIGDVGDPGCGDTMRLYIKIEENVITGLSFKICGCVAALASASVTTVLVKGKTIDEALMITNKDISDALGGLPEQKLHCSVLGEESIRKAVADYRSKKTTGGEAYICYHAYN
ncbi:MAG: iron-sulfur cluster assembly scaffold protein [Clostridiaceae bacterium]|jgi:nitrogen fixation NifU-like protein|nr:iron-sulfur cluster assembly scaffold protein [Clostridiaceae bacterium]